jgi:hypothetical protein
MAWAEDRATWATRPERRPRDQDRRGRHEAALSFPFGIGTKAVNRSYVHQFRLLRISRHQFLHFTVNQYNVPNQSVGRGRAMAPR